MEARRMRQRSVSIVLSLVYSLLMVVFSPVCFAWAEIIELKLAQWDPPQSDIAQLTQQAVERINKRAAGRLKVVPYYGESLIKQAEHYRATQLGIVDIAYFGPTAPGSPVQLSRVISLPYLGFESPRHAVNVFNKLLERVPEVRDEYKDLEVMGVFALRFDNLHTTKKLVRTPEDLKGMKIIAFGPRANYIKAAGGSPVTIPVGEWYTSLERGLVEGLFFLTNAVPLFRLEGLLKNHTILNSSTGVNFWLVNKKKWNSLPPDLQKIIREELEWRAIACMSMDEENEKKYLESFKEQGHTIYVPTKVELGKWSEKAQIVHQEWIESVEKMGLPGRKVYEKVREIIKEETGTK